MADATVKLVLASASPRRLALLEQVGLNPDLLNPVDMKERPGKRETPRAFALRMAKEKAAAAMAAPLVRELEGPAYILAADTVVAVGRRILGKAGGIEEAARALKLLSGRSHKVITAVALATPAKAVRTRIVETKVRFKRLSRDDLDTYLACDEWRGKAGAYAIQGRAGAFVRHINGSYTAVVGLPLYETVSLLAGNGFPVHYMWMHGVAEDIV